MLCDYYNHKYAEISSLEELITLMTTKRLIPLEPKLYIVRYDEDFISSVNEKTAATIAAMNIVGTVVCIYQEDKHTRKCDKYLGDYTVSFSTVSPEYIIKYLTKDFPSLPESFIKLAVELRPDYQGASMLCYSMSVVPNKSISSTSQASITHAFGCDSHLGETQLKIGIASRNFEFILSVLDNYQDDLGAAYYVILSTMIEMEKILTSKYKTTQGLAAYKSCWTLESVYFVFMHTFEELQKIRTYTSFDVYDSLVYIAGLLQFTQIPSVEVMSHGIC